MKKAVICFTRVPKPGLTKTRLLPVLDPHQCVRLHWAFLKDLAGTYRKLDAHLFVAYTPDADWESLKTVFPHAGFYPQKGNDLGERMYRVIRKVLGLGYESVILTGADLPLMTPEHLAKGFAVLEEADIAIGPTSDGGYYLVGMKQPHRAIFENQRYGGETVLENTKAAGEAAGLTVVLANPCDDVDTPEDLRSLTMELSSETATFQYLTKLKKDGVSL